MNFGGVGTGRGLGGVGANNTPFSKKKRTTWRRITVSLINYPNLNSLRV